MNTEEFEELLNDLKKKKSISNVNDKKILEKSKEDKKILEKLKEDKKH
jgi:hypothetical protein